MRTIRFLLKFETSGDQVNFTVPAMRIYSMIVVAENPAVGGAKD